MLLCASAYVLMCWVGFDQLDTLCMQGLIVEFCFSSLFSTRGSLSMLLILSHSI